MTTTDLAPRTTDGVRLRAVAGATFAVAVGMPIAAILTAGARDVEVQPGLIDWIFVAAVAATTLVTFGALRLWLRRRPGARTAGVGLTLSLLAVVATPVGFWTMLPVVLGVAGAWLGLLGRQDTRPGGHGRATAAVVLGALAAVSSVAMYVATS